MSAISVSHFNMCTVVHLKIILDAASPEALTAALNQACDQVPDSGSATVLHFELGDTQRNAALASDKWTMSSINAWERALRRIERLNAMTIATVIGHCNWTGLSLLLATDYRIAHYSSSFWLGARTDGFLPGMSIHRLATQLGAARVRELVLLGQKLQVENALALGLLNETVEDTEAAVRNCISKLDGNVVRDLPVRRRLLLEACSLSYDDALGAHLAACDRFLRYQHADASGATGLSNER